MSIFAKPKVTQKTNDYGVKVMFLHGLEGSPNGTKASALVEEWAAVCPAMRTLGLANLRSQCSGAWHTLNQEEIDKHFEVPYQDAKDAVRYANPDVIVGSSMGAAILFKLIAEGHFTGSAVFCAPAIGNLLSDNYVHETLSNNAELFTDSVWLFGEVDTVVSNSYHLKIAKSVNGSIIFSPNDGHRLNKAVNSNILNSAVLTSIELLGS